MLKILQARLQQYMNRELPNIQDDFKKAEESEIKLPTLKKKIHIYFVLNSPQ